MASPAFTAHNGDHSLEALSAPFAFDETHGEVIGEHNGAHYYTIGQRKGLNIGGKEKPLFIIGTDTSSNIIYTGQGEDHPGLYRKGLFIPRDEVHWVRPDKTLSPGETLSLQCRIRYRQPLQHCTLHMEDHGMYIIFEKEQRGITPGQFAAWYHENELLGSGVIQ